VPGAANGIGYTQFFSPFIKSAFFIAIAFSGPPKLMLEFIQKFNSFYSIPGSKKNLYYNNNAQTKLNIE
jgi:hypothetical protein